MITRGSAATPATILAVVAAASGCGDGGPSTPPGQSELVSRYGLELLPPMMHPANNPPDPARVDLGRLIFFDPVQSGEHDVACSTCHLPRFGFADGRDLPAGPSGVGLGPERTLMDPKMVLEARNAPTVVNVGFNRFIKQWTPDGFMFWDGRKRRLENLVTLPQREFSEMRGDTYPVEVTLDTLIARLRSIPEYEERFQGAFPDRTAQIRLGTIPSAIDSLSISMALAQFVRSLESRDSPYDRFVAGDEDALTEQQRRGLVLFHEKGGCADCHTGPMFSDFDFHVVGARQQGPGFQETPHEDFGRWGVTRLESDRFRFRTPSLRNVAETAPYMHAGGYATLRDAVEFFNRGGGDHPFVSRESLELQPLGLSSREIDDIVAFLESLTDLPDVEVPTRLPSGLEPPH